MPSEKTLEELTLLENELDVHYKEHPYFQDANCMSPLVLLAAFDHIGDLELRLGAANADRISVAQFRSMAEDGLTQALQWIYSSPNITDEFDPAKPMDPNSAFSFLVLASKYSTLSDYHRMFHQDLVEANVDLKKKQAQFYYTDCSTSRQNALAFVESVATAQERSSRAQEDSSLEGEAFKALQDRIKLRGDVRFVSFVDTDVLSDPQVSGYCNIFRQDFDYVNPAQDLDGFTVEAFQDYWMALVRWSWVATEIYYSTLCHESQQPLISTQCVPLADYFRTIEKLTGLTAPIVERITNRLSWGMRIRKSDILLQPLLVDSESVMWSPRVILSSRYPRNMLKLMSRMGGKVKNIAERIIGGREKAATDRLAAFLTGRGWTCKTGHGDEVRSSTERGEIDCLAYQEQSPKDVLIIEYKALLDVDEVNEIKDATQKLQDAQDQIERCTRILLDPTGEASRKKYPFVSWDEVKNIGGLVVSLGGEPNEHFDQSGIPTISDDAFTNRVPAEAFTNVSQLLDSCKNRPWLDQLLGDARRVEVEIRSNDLTYLVPMIELGEQAESTMQASEQA